MLLRSDNIAVRYITPAHGVDHSERHLMLYNQPIYILFCIKVSVHGVVKTALLYYLKMSAGTKHIQEATKGDLIVTAFVRPFCFKYQSFSFHCFLIMSDKLEIAPSDRLKPATQKPEEDRSGPPGSLAS